MTGVAFCRLGAVVTDAAGRRYGLTALHVLERENGPVFDAATGALVGIPSPLPSDSKVPGDFFDTIGMFELSAETAIDWSDPLMSRLGTCDPATVTGLAIRKPQTDGTFAEGIIHGYGGSIAFQGSPDAEPVVLRNVLEIAFQDARATAPGEAGAPLFTASGELAGLLMAGTSGRAYAAPLRPFLEDHGLKVTVPRGDATLDAHGRANEMARELRHAAFGAQQLRSDIAKENPKAKDPYLEPVPQDLLELIAEVG